MLDEKFVLIGALFNLAGGSSYIIATLRGETKPNKVTWAIWALAPLIAFSAEVKQGVGLQSLMTFMVGFMPLLVFLSSFVNKEAYWKIGKLDITCGSLSLVGLALWQITQIGNLAILFGILADGLAAIPTIVKSWRFPETETWFVYFTAAVSATLTLMTINQWDFKHYGFPLYILVTTIILSSLIKFRIGKRFESL